MTKYPKIQIRLKQETIIKLKKTKEGFPNWEFFINELLKKYETKI